MSVLFLLAGLALGQDAPPPVILSAAPPVRVVAFQGRPSGWCTDRTAARRGECVDVVDFVRLEPDARVEPTSLAPMLDDMGALHALMLEDLVIRWDAPDVAQTLKRDGYTTFPSASALWGSWSAPDGTWALPRLDRWLGVGAWVANDPSPFARRELGVIFPTVRFAASPGVHVPDPWVTLDGRFALRLGFGGRSYDRDVMDADVATSGPFFEQLFPYAYASSQRSAEDEVYGIDERIPLHAFRRTDAGAGEALRVGPGLDRARELAGEEFESFVHAVFTQTAQFAMEDVTLNQMRVLAALTAIATPPGAVENTSGVVRDLVAAARYETDTAAQALAARTSRGAAVVDPITVRLDALPRPVLDRWVPRIARELGANEAFYADLDAMLRDEIGGLLRVDAGPFTSLDSAERMRWVAANVLPGEDRDAIDARVMRVGLVKLFDGTSADERARYETWMLGDQARLAIAATFDRTKAAAPGEVAETALAQWQTVVGLHGRNPTLSPQGLGAVDPLSVCTTLDGVDALEEPTFGAVDVDLLVPAPDGLTGTDVLAAHGEQLPWVFLDDPSSTPEVTRLIGLGDGRALYRVRWQVWSGWHLLWALEPDGGERRLSLRTAALCDDMVLAPREVVPSVIRAALLAGNLRPSTPERPGDAGPRDVDLSVDSTDAVADGLASAPGAAEDKKKQADEARGLIEEPPLQSMTGPKFKEDAAEIAQEPLSPTALLLRSLVVPRLAELGEGGRLLLEVFDATAPVRGEPLRDLVPRTPYVRSQGRADGSQVRTASWMLWLSPKAKQPVVISPAYRPLPSVAAGDRIPHWGRRHDLDFHLTFGLGGYPWERIRWECGAEVDPSFAGPCEGYVRTAGLSADIQALGTWWAHDKPRIGIDAGLEARLDVRPPGFAPYVTEPTGPVSEPGDLPSLPWALRFEGGLLLGVTFAPGPTPMTRERPNRLVWGSPTARGNAKQDRFRLGLRGGLLFGPGYNGTQASAHMELWTGWAIRKPRARLAPFTPYQPLMLLGPYARGAYAFPLAEGDASRQLLLRESWTVYAGLRMQLRLTRPAKLPEAK